MRHSAFEVIRLNLTKKRKPSPHVEEHHDVVPSIGILIRKVTDLKQYISEALGKDKLDGYFDIIFQCSELEHTKRDTYDCD